MTETLYALAIIACPVGMGVMMWLMMRAGTSNKAPSPERDPELDRLRREVAELRAAQEDGRGAPTVVDERRGS